MHAGNDNNYNKNDDDIFLFASANALTLNSNPYQKRHRTSTEIITKHSERERKKIWMHFVYKWEKDSKIEQTFSNGKITKQFSIAMRCNAMQCNESKRTNDCSLINVNVKCFSVLFHTQKKRKEKEASAMYAATKASKIISLLQLYYIHIGKCLSVILFLFLFFFSLFVRSDFKYVFLKRNWRKWTSR